ncbi:MAG: hypothetical protein V7676_16480 [Parasphingorhabdus sp.]|uniref:hypothetical protein n=1 Tax=Parasphingorhabdus sp. TaxID=2709688 RepID=UPI0030019E6D
MIDKFGYVRACAWTGPILLVALIIFWGLMGYNIPPFGSDVSAEDIAQHFIDNGTVVRIGMTLTVAFSVCYLTWGIAVRAVMEAIDPSDPILPLLQNWGAGLTTLVLSIPGCVWLTAAFRPAEIDPQTTRMLYDLGWILFDVQFSFTVLQLIPMAICFLKDKREIPIVPKWISWFVLWVGCMLPLLGLIGLFKTGPFGRNGLINYWVEFPIFFFFVLLASIAMLKAIPVLEKEK